MLEVGADDGIVDIPALGDDFFRDPYPTYAALRRKGPVHRIRMPQGFDAWLVVGYDEVRTVLADARLSKEFPDPVTSASPGVEPVAPAYHMLMADPPDHTRLRRLVSREFTARRIAALAPLVQEIADGLLDVMLAAPDGRADLVDAFSFPLPITVICELLGVPSLDHDRFRRWSNTALGVGPAEERRGAANQMAAYLADLLEAKRARPGDDLLSGLLHHAGEDDDDRLSTDELLGMAWLLLVAGHETTVNLISNGVLALLRHPDQLAALRADWSLLDNAVEEILRYDGPVPTPTFRFTVEPFELSGTVIPGGGHLVLPAIGDAGRDPDRFAEPDGFDIRRREARGHLAFGHGIHFCLGAPLARLEARVALRTLLERAPGLALDADPDSLFYRPGMLIRGPLHLPVRWRE
ncbi:cytochrome P450 family protein [Streptomyces sp. URMC 129]|uniref:cytochrome P450 family protein n=1 Tax=Streptomyces sp. URMC 129 TaxID=3423407 RepID=UPI003F19984D